MHKCPNCPYESKRAFDLKRHLAKQKSCVPVSTEVSNGVYNEVNYVSNINPNASDMQPNDPNVEPSNVDPTTFVCKGCARAFSRKQTLQVHQEKCTGVGVMQCQNCHKEFTSAQGKYKHLKSVKCSPIQIPNGATPSIFTTNNYNAPYTYVNGNQINNNFAILNFGCENIQHLLEDKEFMDRMLAFASKAKTPEAKAEVVPLIVQKLHFDPAHPENQTIKMTNSRGSTVKVHTKDGWKHERWDKAIDRVNDKANACLEEHADVDETYVPDGFDEYIHATVNDEQTRKKMRRETKNVLLNAAA